MLYLRHILMSLLLHLVHQETFILGATFHQTPTSHQIHCYIHNCASNQERSSALHHSFIVSKHVTHTCCPITIIPQKQVTIYRPGKFHFIAPLKWVVTFYCISYTPRHKIYMPSAPNLITVACLCRATNSDAPNTMKCNVKP